MRLLTATLALSFVVIPHLAAQEQPDVLRRVQLAQSLEQAGEWAKAAGIYEDLLRTDSLNFMTFDGLRRAYVQLKEYGKASSLIERRLAHRPSEVFLVAQLGGLAYDAGNIARADSLWGAVLQTAGHNRQMVVLVAQQMQERRLYDRAIQTFEAGRALTKNPHDFVEDLALLHSATQSYGKAAAEYLRLLRSAPHQLGYIQSRIASFTMKQEGLRDARSVVEAAIEDRPTEVPLRSLMAWLAVEQSDYPAALQQYRAIDSLSNASGVELYNFAQRCLREHAYGPAADAFRHAIARGPAGPLILQSRLGYARAMEELAVRDTAAARMTSTGSTASESFPSLDAAVTLYRELVRDAPGSDVAVQALFRVGVVAYERTFDLDGALDAFLQVTRIPRAGAMAWEAYLRASDVCLAKNDLAGTAAALRSIPATASPEIQDRVIFSQARLAAYEGRVDSALALLGPLAVAVDRDLANDAIGLQVFLKEHRTAMPALTGFLRGELLQRQRKYAEALAQFRGVATEFPTALISDHALVQAADLLVLLSRPVEAVAAYRAFVDERTMSMLRDRALFRAGDVTERSLKDPAAALKVYDLFLETFPHSLYVEEVRIRIRRLRGEVS
ncbi:MAG: tetratricopeptide repeat protein [Bacteroidetes bacterium]|jgi:tetratricopeptide (TPR) repeat protein|nr:tetratricopeptide repeat protein [Bacteroidota bacterium]